MWTPCLASVDTSNGSIELSRFGHTATAIVAAGATPRSSSSSDDSSGSDGSDSPQCVVVYGGVCAQRGPDGAILAQKALGDVLLLTVGGGGGDAAWAAPAAVAAPATGGPGPRAFHAAAAAGPGALVVFGGHIHTLEAGTGRRKRLFFNDLWSLDAVRGRLAFGGLGVLISWRGGLVWRQDVSGSRCSWECALKATKASPQADWEWRRVEPAAASPAPQKRDMACLLPVGEGRLLLFGGRNEQQRALGDCWLFDVDT
jgi:hypothetical protein